MSCLLAFAWSRNRRGRGYDRVSAVAGEAPFRDRFLHVRRNQVLDLDRVDFTRATVADLEEGEREKGCETFYHDLKNKWFMCIFEILDICDL